MVTRYATALLATLLLLAGCSGGQSARQQKAERHLEAALAYQQQGYLEAAMIEAQNAVRMAPAQADGYLTLARLYNRVGAHRATVHLLANLTLPAGDLTAVSNELAAAYIAQGDYGTAMALLEHFAAPPGSAEHSHYQQLLQVARAGVSGNSHPLFEPPENRTEQELLAALAALPATDLMTKDQATLLCQLRTTLLQLGRTSEAYAQQRKLEDYDPERLALRHQYRAAAAEYQAGHYREAERLFGKIYQQLHPYQNTGVLLSLEDKPKWQITKPEEAPPALIQAAVFNQFIHETPEETLALLRNAVQQHPNNPVLIATYGLVLLQYDPSSNTGVLALEKSLSINPHQPQLRVPLAYQYYALQQHHLGNSQLLRAFVDAPQDGAIQEQLVTELFNQQEFSQAEREITRFQEAYPQDPRGYYLDGWLQLMRENVPQAIAAFEYVLSTPNGKEQHLSYAGLAHAYTLRDQPQRAINAWQSAIQEKPNRIDAYPPWVQLVTDLKREREAVRFLLELESANKENWLPSAVLAQLYSSQGDIEAAVTHIEKALTRKPIAPIKELAGNIYYQYGLMLADHNKPDDALSAFLQALKFSPGNGIYFEKVSDIH